MAIQIVYLRVTDTSPYEMPSHEGPVKVEVWGPGGDGGGNSLTDLSSGCGGAGGEYAMKVMDITNAQMVNFLISGHGTEGVCWFLNDTTVLAHGGQNGGVSSAKTQALPIGGGIGDLVHQGGPSGINGQTDPTNGSEYTGGTGGGGGAGPHGNGGKGADNTPDTNGGGGGGGDGGTPGSGTHGGAGGYLDIGPGGYSTANGYYDGGGGPRGIGGVPAGLGVAEGDYVPIIDGAGPPTPSSAFFGQDGGGGGGYGGGGAGTGAGNLAHFNSVGGSGTDGLIKLTFSSRGWSHHSVC